MRIVPMTKEHTAQVAGLETRCFSDPWSEASIRGELDNPLSLWLVALEGDTVAGYVGSQAVLDEADIRTVDDLARITPAKFRELMKLSSAMDKERQDVIWDAIRKLFEESGNAFKQKLFRK